MIAEWILILTLPGVYFSSPKELEVVVGFPSAELCKRAASAWVADVTRATDVRPIISAVCVQRR